jgi:hypothetical protein
LVMWSFGHLVMWSFGHVVKWILVPFFPLPQVEVGRAWYFWGSGWAQASYFGLGFFRA